jgi:hypothetical protein
MPEAGDRKRLSEALEGAEDNCLEVGDGFQKPTLFSLSKDQVREP